MTCLISSGGMKCVYDKGHDRCDLLQAYEAESFLVSAQDAHKAAQEHVNLHAEVHTCLTHSCRQGPMRRSCSTSQLS